MPIYQYRAKGFDGKTVKGQESATSKEELINILRKKDLFLLEVEEAKEQNHSKKMKAKDVAAFSRELGMLLSSGISLARALTIMQQQPDIKPYTAKILNNLNISIKQGNSLSSAMEEQGNAFPSLLINMYRSSEMNGSLDAVALRMADHYDKDVKLNSKVKGAMVYPCILLGLSVVIIIGIVTFIIPQFESLFKGLDSLPGITRFLIAFSHLLTNRWYLVIGVIVAIVLLIRFILSFPENRLKFDHFKINIPYVGNLMKTIYTARFARTLSSLYSSGMPIISSLDIGKTTIGNTYIESQFAEVKRKLKAGESLSSSLSNIDGFLTKLSSTVEIGEESGNLDEMLNNTCDNLDFEAEQAISRLVSMLEPIMIIIMGIFVLLIVAGIIVPIYQSYGAIDQGY